MSQRSRGRAPALLFRRRGPALATLLWVASVPALAGSVALPGLPGTNLSVDVPSQQEARWDSIVRQQHDFSCGSAAVATLLSFHYDRPTDEKQVFQSMFERGDQQRIRQQGFSMLDMKGYLDSQGLNSDGFRITLDKIDELQIPIIALVNTKGYRHFVVVKGVEDGRVLVGDPAIGMMALTREAFNEIWDGTALIARDKQELAKANFNKDAEWSTWPHAPIGHGMDRAGLGLFTVTLPGLNEFGR